MHEAWSGVFDGDDAAFTDSSEICIGAFILGSCPYFLFFSFFYYYSLLVRDYIEYRGPLCL